MQGVASGHHSGLSYLTMKASGPSASTSVTPSTDDPAGAAAGSSNAGSSGAAAGSAPGVNPLSGQNAVAAMLGNGETITGGVTATLPDGMTIGVWSLSGAAPGQASAANGSASDVGSNDNAASSGPDYGAMEAALEQMVDQFMANTSSSAAAAANQAYGASALAPSGAAQGGAADVLA